MFFHGASDAADTSLMRLHEQRKRCFFEAARWPNKRLVDVVVSTPQYSAAHRRMGVIIIYCCSENRNQN